MTAGLRVRDPPHSESAAIAHYIRSAILSGYADLVRSAGLSPYPMLDAAGLPRGCVNEPDMKIPTAAVVRLLEDAAQESGIEDFGLRLAEIRTYAALGALGLVVREQATLRGGVDACIRYMRLTTNSLIIRLEESPDLSILRMRFAIADRAARRQFTELTVGIVHHTFRTLLGREWRPTAYCFSHSEPKSLETHHRFFGPSVEFGHEFDGVVLTPAALDAAIPGADPGIARQLERYAEHLGGRINATSLEQVRERIIELLPTGACSIGRVASHLGVDQRTVQRRLSAEGWTFSSLLNEIRCEYVTHYLTTGGRSFSDAAGLLGFSGPSAFTRWFRTAFGCPPSQWRDAQRRALIADRAERAGAHAAARRPK